MAEEPEKNKRISKVETVEFIKKLKRSEYLVVEELKKLLARISSLPLLLSSEAHWDALLKILNESHVLEAIATKDLEQIVRQIVGTNTITYPTRNC